MSYCQLNYLVLGLGPFLEGANDTPEKKVVLKKYLYSKKEEEERIAKGPNSKNGI